MAEENQKLGIAILEFLEKSIMDGSVLEDDKQKIEIASKPLRKRGKVACFVHAGREHIDM